jgi:hypothetical protein
MTDLVITFGSFSIHIPEWAFLSLLALVGPWFAVHTFLRSLNGQTLPRDSIILPAAPSSPAASQISAPDKTGNNQPSPTPMDVTRLIAKEERVTSDASNGDG